MGVSTCVACGECVQACPTGALMPARDVALPVPDKQVDSRLPVSAASAASSPTTSRTTRSSTSRVATAPPTTGRLCVKGRYGFDYAHHPHRLTAAADPPRRRAAQARRLRDGPGAGDGRVPRSELGRSARLRRRHAEPDPRPRRPASRWPASARPRAATKRPTCSRSSSAPVSAATTSTIARACATPRRWWRCSKASARARCPTR